MSLYPKINRKPKIRVFLYASQRIILDGLCMLLESTGDIDVVDNTDRIENVSFLNRKNEPDVLVLCLMNKDAGNVEIINDLKSAADSPPRILVLTSSEDVAVHRQALQYGAAGIIHKDQDAKSLLRAVKQISEGETWINQKLIAHLLNKDKIGNNGDGNKRIKDWEEMKIDSVTRREREIINMVSRGMKNKEIGKTLFISEATVRHHLSSIYSKLDLEDRLNLVIYSYRHNLIEAEPA